jgi:hypothetical protein
MKAVPRLITLAAMFASVVTIVGGTLAATAVPSSGAPGGTNVCTGFTATANVLTSVATGTLTGCHQQGSGTTLEIVDPNNPLAPTPVTIAWATGHATSEAIVTVVPGPTTAACPLGTGDVSLNVVDGPYTGSNGHFVQCLQSFSFPNISGISLGPVVV